MNNLFRASNYNNYYNSQNRGNEKQNSTIPNHPCPPSKPPCAPPPPKKTGPKKAKKNKLDFKKFKNNTICSLNEVEDFLCDFNRFCKYVKLYKILK